MILIAFFLAIILPQATGLAVYYLLKYFKKKTSRLFSIAALATISFVFILFILILTVQQTPPDPVLGVTDFEGYKVLTIMFLFIIMFLLPALHLAISGAFHLIERQMSKKSI